MKKLLIALVLGVGLYSSMEAHRYRGDYQTYYPVCYSYPVVYREPVYVEYVRPAYIRPACECTCCNRPSYPRIRYSFSWGFGY